MTLAKDILAQREPNYDLYVRQGRSLDDIDEYGFTFLIEGVLTHQIQVIEALLERGVDINKPDVMGRTALFWAVDNGNYELAELLLNHGADPNAYTIEGMAILVFPLLRRQDKLKQLLYKFGAKLDFALDFIYGKLIGHRFELQGYLNIVNPHDTFIELSYEGFILEFTVAVIKDTLYRFTNSYSTRHWRTQFPYLYPVMDAFSNAAELLQLQRNPVLTKEHKLMRERLLQSPMLVLPAASSGHAMGFIRYHQWWAKIDRGENSKKEGSVNIYRITKPEMINADFLQAFLFKRQPRHFFHETINHLLGLEPVIKMPVSSQITGNCSWANMQAIVPVGYAMQQLTEKPLTEFKSAEAMSLYDTWVQWDQDRAINECIQRFYLANPMRKATIATMLGAILFQACDNANDHDVERAEKILAILKLPEYFYILHNYLDVYCVKRLTRRGNNLLKLLDDCGVDSGINVAPIATGLKERE